MRNVFAAAALLLAGPAWSQTSWANDRFTMSTDNLTGVSIAGDTVQVDWLPVAVSNPASASFYPSVFFDLDFAAQPGYLLIGERVDFSVELNDEAYSAASDMLLPAQGSFTVDIDGEYSLSATGAGGIQHYSGTYLLHRPDLVARIDESVMEGIACPSGHDDNGCNFGLDWVGLQSLVEMTSFSVTPVLAPVREPGSTALLTTAVGSLALVAAVRRRKIWRTCPN
jgi:hypothetical protein